MNAMNNSQWSLDAIEAAMDEYEQVLIGHLALGRGTATLPSALDGTPVEVPLTVAWEAIRHHQGWCWIDDDGRLVGWPEDGPEDGSEGPEDGPEGPGWRVEDDAAFEVAAGCRALDARHEGLVALETAARPDVVWLAAFDDRGGRWFGSDPHGVLWAAWDGETLCEGSWRWDDPPRWARALVARVTRAIPVEALA